MSERKEGGDIYVSFSLRHRFLLRQTDRGERRSRENRRGDVQVGELAPLLAVQCVR